MPEREECPLREDCVADADRLARALSDAGDAIAERNALRIEREALQRDLAQAREMLAINRKIRAYISFVLADDENADSQLAADQARAEIDRLRAALAELRPLLVFFGEKWRWFLKDGDTYHAAFLADVRALAQEPAK